MRAEQRTWRFRTAIRQSRRSRHVGGTQQTELVTRRGFLLFAALGIAWGIPYLFIKVAVSELEPAMVVLGRSALAAVLLLPLAFYRREVWQVVRRWKPMAAYTLVEIVLPWYFLSSAEQRLPSSTAGLLLATVPLAGVAIAFIMGRPERLTRLNWLGILFGMLGVAALVGLDIAGSDLIAVAEMAVVHNLAVLGQFAQGSLQRGAVRLDVLLEPLPPVEPSLDDFGEFCFRNTIVAARVDQKLTPDTTIPEMFGDALGQSRTFNRSALIDSDDRHD